MSREILSVVRLFDKSKLLLLCCLIIKGIKFCLWLVFIISKGNIVPRCLTLNARHSFMFSCNTNTQTDRANSRTQTRVPIHTLLVFILLYLSCSLSHAHGLKNRCFSQSSLAVVWFTGWPLTPAGLSWMDSRPCCSSNWFVSNMTLPDLRACVRLCLNAYTHIFICFHVTPWSQNLQQLHAVPFLSSVYF